MNEIILFIMLGVLCASCLAAVFGFGEAMLLVPLLTPVIGIKQAVPLVSLLAVVLNLTILIQDWRIIRFRTILPLILSAGCCVPLGIYVLRNVDSPIFKYLLGAVIIAFAIYNLVGKQALSLKNDNWAWLFGGIAGTMGGAYNIAGPPVVMYASLRGWNPNTFRASLQGFFAPLSVVIVIGHFFSGNYNMQVGIHFAWAFPMLVAGIWIGNIIHHKIENPARFKKFIYGLLVVLGAMLFI